MEGLYLTEYLKCPNRGRQTLGHESRLVTVTAEGFVCLRFWLTFTDIPVGPLKELLPLLVNLALPVLLNYYIYCITDISVTPTYTKLTEK